MGFLPWGDLGVTPASANEQDELAMLGRTSLGSQGQHLECLPAWSGTLAFPFVARQALSHRSLGKMLVLQSHHVLAVLKQLTLRILSGESLHLALPRTHSGWR